MARLVFSALLLAAAAAAAAAAGRDHHGRRFGGCPSLHEDLNSLERRVTEADAVVKAIMTAGKSSAGHRPKGDFPQFCRICTVHCTVRPFEWFERRTTSVVIIIVIPREKKGQLAASKLCSKLDSIGEDDRETTFLFSTIDIHSLPFLVFFRFQEAPTTPRNSPSSTPTRAPRWSCLQTGEKEKEKRKKEKKTDILGMLLLSFGFSFSPSPFPHQHIHACFSFKGEAGEVHSADPLSFSPPSRSI